MWVYSFESEYLVVKVFDEYGGFDYDQFYIQAPSETKSAGWEVWLAEWHDPDLKRADLIRKQLEIHSSWVTSSEHVRLIIKALSIGFDAGEKSGKSEMQTIFKFSMAAMTGAADTTDIHEAALQAGYGPDDVSERDDWDE